MLGRKLHSGTLKTKESRAGTGTSSFVSKIPLRNLRPSIINSVPCDRILQRAYSYENVLRLQVHFHANQTHFDIKGFA